MVLAVELASKENERLNISISLLEQVQFPTSNNPQKKKSLECCVT